MDPPLDRQGGGGGGSSPHTKNFFSWLTFSSTAMSIVFHSFSFFKNQLFLCLETLVQVDLIEENPRPRQGSQREDNKSGGRYLLNVLSPFFPAKSYALHPDLVRCPALRHHALLFFEHIPVAAHQKMISHALFSCADFSLLLDNLH